MLAKTLLNDPYDYSSINQADPENQPLTSKKRRMPRTSLHKLQSNQVPQWQVNLMWTLIGVTLGIALAVTGLSIFDFVKALDQHNIDKSTNTSTNITTTEFHNTTINSTTYTFINSTCNETFVKTIIPGNADTIVNDTDPEFPVVSFLCNFTGIVQTIVNGTGILVNNSVPEEPIVSTTAILTITPGTPSVTIDNADPQNLIFSVNTTIQGPCVESVSGGVGITVDNTDPFHPNVSTTAILEIIPGLDININNSDIQRPVISANITIPLCVETITPGLGIGVDNTNPLNPIVNNTGVIIIYGSTNIQIDNTNTQYPIISTNLSTNVIQQPLQDSGSKGDPFLLSTQSGTLGFYKNQGAAAHSRLVILLQSGSVSDNVFAQTQGLITGLSGFISGAFYYYDTSTNVLTTTPTSYFAGYAFSSTSFFFSPQPIYIP
jgi:hypothetical protein